MSALKESPKEEERYKSMSESSVELMSDPAFSPGGERISEPTVQCPRENMTPNGDQADLLTHVRFIDSVCPDGPAKAAYVNGSASPNSSDEDLLDISKNIPGFLPNSVHVQNSPNAAGMGLEDCDPLQKDGEMTIRQVVTSEDVEDRGIWGFDADSPENALEVYGNGNDLDWDPHKEFKKFLMEDQIQPKTEEKMPAPPPPGNSRRRKRKMDMVVMVDPSEDDFSSFDFDSTHEHQGEGSQGRTASKYSNGTTVAFKHGFPKPAKNRKTSQNNHLNQKPFVCKECEQPFFDHNSLLKHITVHQKKRPKIVEAVKGREKIKNKGKDARLRCPQCPFGTDCPNDFISHAQTHVKDKRYPCQKCNFKALNDIELMSHVIRKHPVTSAPTSGKGKQDRLQERKGGASDKTAATPGRLKPRKAHFVKNHVEFLRRPILDEEERSSSPPERTSDDSTRLLQRDRTKPKDNGKLDKSVSRLDKSINTLLSRKMNCKQRTSHSNSDRNFNKINVRSEGPDLGRSCNYDFIDLDTTLTRKDVSVSPSKRKGGLFELKEGNFFINKPDGLGDACQGFGNDDGSEGERSSTNEEPVPLVKTSLKKSPSKRKMSTPFHNLQGQDILIDFPKCRQMFQKSANLYVINKHDAADLGVSGHMFSKNVTHKKGSPRSSDPSEQDLGFPEMISIKEECEETEVCSDTMNSSPIVTNGKFRSPLKPCPYCPALFESGIGLSNHIRGHLHRVGVSYNARHAVSAAEVASHDKGHTIRRRAPAVPRIKTEVDLPPIDHSQTVHPWEEKYELVCPLCREWFDSKTGLSNHVRGHLKRLGKPCASSMTKSPVLILKELMRDKKQFQAKLQTLEKKYRSRGSSYHFSLSNGVIVTTAKVQRFTQGGKRQGLASSQSGEEKRRTENDEDEMMKGSPSSDLIGILKKRRAHEEARAKSQPQTARKALHISPAKESDPSGLLPNSVSEKNDLNRKVCVHCNTTFPSGVSLSNHLRAYARRKKNALLDGTTYDCKRKQRSRSGSKKKTHPLLQTPEEIYRLTCRFCDLVFQGPLSVQEDWVKHLQRHIMNTAVPHTGAAMVEVTAFPTDPNTHTPPQTSL